MPRTVDYPHAAFKSSIDLATAVDYLGGSCSVINCAERLNKKVSGAFKSLVSAAVKHGLITVKKDVLNTTELYRLYKFSYNEEEKLDTLRKAFLYPVLYQKIYERFKGKELPVSMLDKLIIRELAVEESYGSRVAGYFVDGVFQRMTKKKQKELILTWKFKELHQLIKVQLQYLMLKILMPKTTLA
jgi:hypothetical protein